MIGSRQYPLVQLVPAHPGEISANPVQCFGKGLVL